MKQYKSVYIAGKLFNPFDRLISQKICDVVAKVYASDDVEIYLPYRDSNMKVAACGNVSENIFKADINQLNRTDLMVARLDGMAYDSGVAFEIGYCIGKGIPIVTISTDYYRISVAGKDYLFSQLIDKMTLGYRYEFVNHPNMSYAEELVENIDNFYKGIGREIEKHVLGNDDEDENENYLGCLISEYADKIGEAITSGIGDVDVYIDFAGMQYEWCIDYAKRLADGLNAYNCFIVDRFRNDYSAMLELDALRKSKVVIVSLEGMEPDTDSSVLQGIAFALHKPIIGYETSKKSYYVRGGHSMHVNLMNENACMFIAKSFEEIIETTEDLLNNGRGQR